MHLTQGSSRRPLSTLPSTPIDKCVIHHLKCQHSHLFELLMGRPASILVPYIIKNLTHKDMLFCFIMVLLFCCCSYIFWLVCMREMIVLESTDNDFFRQEQHKGCILYEVIIVIKVNENRFSFFHIP